MEKLTLSFYTNMPTPYQLDFFEALSSYFALNVVYFSERERDRIWNLNSSSPSYEAVSLEDSLLTKLIQKRVESYHFSWRIFKVLLKDKSEFVIVNGTYWSPNTIIVLIMSGLRGKKIAYFTEPVFPTKSKFFSYLKFLLLFPVRIFSNFIFAVGKLAEISFRRYGYRKPIYNIPYNINTAAFERRNLIEDELSKISMRLNPDKSVVILSSGSLIARKGMDIVIQAFLKLPQNIKARLIIVGSGPELSMLKSITNDDNRIHFVGFVEKGMLPYYFGIADIFVCASRYDGWGLIINEAVAADIAIISSDKVGSVEDKFLHKNNALICPSGDVTCFRNAMYELIVDDDLRRKLVENNRNLKNFFSSDFNAKLVHDIFRDSK